MPESSKKTPYEPFPEPRSPSEMSALSHDDAIRISAQRQEQGSRASLVEALMRMGRWDEAFVVETDPVSLASIQSLKEGEERDDTERCGCRNMVDVTDYVRYGQVLEAEKDKPEDEKTAHIELKEHPHYLPSFRHWSSKHGEMVWSHICFICGHTQSLPGPIDELNAVQAKAQARVAQIEYARPGAKIRTGPGVS